jgi:hypothetical protein
MPLRYEGTKSHSEGRVLPVGWNQDIQSQEDNYEADKEQ